MRSGFLNTTSMIGYKIVLCIDLSAGSFWFCFADGAFFYLVMLYIESSTIIYWQSSHADRLGPSMSMGLLFQLHGPKHRLLLILWAKASTNDLHLKNLWVCQLTSHLHREQLFPRYAHAHCAGNDRILFVRVKLPTAATT